MTLEQCLDILGPIRLHRDRVGHLMLDQKRALMKEIIDAARRRLRKQILAKKRAGAFDSTSGPVSAYGIRHDT